MISYIWKVLHHVIWCELHLSFPAESVYNTMLVSFNIKCIRRDKRQCRNGEACRASLRCFEADKIDIKRH